MVYVVLGMPFALLGALFAMDVVEHWVDGVATTRAVQPDLRLLVPQQRRANRPYDPDSMGSPEAALRSL